MKKIIKTRQEYREALADQYTYLSIKSPIKVVAFDNECEWLDYVTNSKLLAWRDGTDSVFDDNFIIDLLDINS